MFLSRIDSPLLRSISLFLKPLKYGEAKVSEVCNLTSLSGGQVFGFSRFSGGLMFGQVTAP